MLAVQPVHPFPARMAPEIALRELQYLHKNAVVLDPMMGSGTVLRVAVDQGLHAIGRDVDPLAVLMTRVWTTSLDTERLRKDAAQLVHDARRTLSTPVSLSWIDEDPETFTFIDYWFAEPQKTDLRKLSSLIRRVDGPEGDALRLALSRIIVTKDLGASLARDVSHSRPHRVLRENSFSVMDGFLRAVHHIAQRLESTPPRGQADVRREDARRLTSLVDASIDVVLTSPPYLNAIDYLRGHRLSLVWLGYRLQELRAIRSVSVGTERGPEAQVDTRLADEISQHMGVHELLPRYEFRMLQRYILDLSALLKESHRVLRPQGKVIFVIGNSCVRGVFIRNAQALLLLAERHGFRLLREEERELPPDRRYLPPPGELDPSDLRKRMRTETVLTLARIE